MNKLPTIEELAKATAEFWYVNDKDEVFIALGMTRKPLVSRIHLGKVSSRGTGKAHEVYAHFYEGWDKDYLGLAVFAGAVALMSYNLKGELGTPEICP